MGWNTRIGDKAGAFRSVVSAMGCAACFPALLGFGAAVGPGFRLAGKPPPRSRWMRTAGQAQLTAWADAEMKI